MPVSVPVTKRPLNAESRSSKPSSNCDAAAAAAAGLAAAPAPLDFSVRVALGGEGALLNRGEAKLNTAIDVQQRTLIRACRQESSSESRRRRFQELQTATKADAELKSRNARFFAAGGSARLAVQCKNE